MLNENNPLMKPYGTPHDTAPFTKITLNDYEEAMLEGIRRAETRIDMICANADEPTFDNTISLPQHDEDEMFYYSLLGRTSMIFHNLLSAETNDEMDKLAQKMQPILTKHNNDVSLNKTYFERIKHVYEVYYDADKHADENGLPLAEADRSKHRALNAEELTVLKNNYEGFVRSGALLSEADKETLRKLSDEESRLSLQFSQNLLKETKAFKLVITDEQDLDGLPQTAIDAARQDDGTWVFTLDSPSYGPFMTYCKNRELRRQMFMASGQRCIHDNSENNLEICKRLVNLARESVQLLGYKNFADYVLEHRMASNVENVYKLLNDLIDAYKPKALEERAEIVRMAKSIEGEDFQMMPWDSAFYSHKLELERYNLDSEMLRPYFKLENVIKGVFGLANTLYGITFRENKDIPVYHPDVKAYEVFDKDGSYLAVFYADFHPRKGKRGGAWMTEFRGQFIDDNGKNHRPHVSVVMNLTKPTAEKPALLTLGEVETFLHEFGHSLHGMFANSQYGSLSGTNVWWDFVELPSQFMENYAVERDFLRTFAVHYETGEPIPDELIDRIIASRNYCAAMGCLRQVSFGLLDMAYYTQEKEFTEDIIPFEKKAWEKAIISEQRMDTCMTVQFSHIMSGGYSAGYYSYKWAEVLDADAFAVFKREGIFNQETAQRFRDCILSKGSTEHPMTLYKRFRGSEPTIDALLERNGIKTATIG